MHLTNIKKITYSEIVKLFDKTQKRELRLIKKADTKLGNWIEAEITLNDLASTYLTHHRARGCGGLSLRFKDFILVPFSGLTLRDAYANLKKHKKRYRTDSKICYDNFTYQKKQITHNNLTPLILTESPLEVSLASGWIKNRDAYVIIDGLHRALAYLELQKYKKIKIIIAVKKISTTKKTMSKYGFTSSTDS